jgi:hypothetical protein
MLYLVLREPAFALCAAAGKPPVGLPSVGEGEVGFFEKPGL